MSYHACLLGASLETGNMGVSALTMSLVKNIIDRIPAARITLIISHHTTTLHTMTVGGRNLDIPSQNFRLSPRSRPRDHILWIFLLALLSRLLPFLRKRIVAANPLLRTLAGADFIGNINGGDSFSDIYDKKRFILSALITRVIILLGKPFVLLPQTYGPYYAKSSLRTAQRIVRKARWAVSRDQAGIAWLKETLPGKEAKILFCPDVAFNLEAIQPQAITTTPQADLESKRGWIGVNVSGLLYHGGYTGKNMFGLAFDYKAFIRELIMRLAGETDAPLLLVPHTYAQPGSIEDDRAACLDVRATLPAEAAERVFVLTSDHDQNGIKWIIGRTAFFIGSRMHSCIAGLSQSIPTVGVAYSKKFDGVFSSIGAGHLVVDARTTNTNTAIGRILALYGDREREQERIGKLVAEARQKIAAVFDTLLGQGA